MINLFSTHFSDDLNHLYLPVFPVIFIDLRDTQEAADMLTVDVGKLSDFLTKYPYAKATTHMVLASDDPDHDFPSYADDTAGEMGISTEEFLEYHGSHELIHLLIDELTYRFFGVTHTWFNEGAVEVLAGFAQRQLMTCVLELEIQDYQDFHQIMHNSDTNKNNKYGGGTLLALAIAQSYAPGQLAATLDSDNQQLVLLGLLEFSKMLFRHGDRADKPNLNEAVIQVLTEESKLEQVYQRAYEIYLEAQATREME